jgi:hypothetical protein
VATRPALIVAALTALGIWALGEHFGAMFTGSGTDPSTGPLLILLAAAYWPLGRAGLHRADQPRADDHSFLAASGPVMRSSSGSVAAMTASDSTSPASTLR